MPGLGLRNDVYRRPLSTALERLGVGPGWCCADIGAGGGDVSVALAEVVGPAGRVYAVDINPELRDAVAQAAAEAGGAQVVAITMAAEDLLLPEPGPGLLPVPADARRRPIGCPPEDGLGHGHRRLGAGPRARHLR